MKLKFLQEGGEIAPEEQPQDPLQEIISMAAQAVEANDPNMAMQVCQALVELAQQASQEQAPAPEPEPAGGEPVFKQGGKLVRRI